jgi:hypothetical protein
MKQYVVSIILFCVLATVLGGSFVSSALESETQNDSGKYMDQTQPHDTLDNKTALLAQMYTPDQIDEMIYRLRDDIQNNNTESGHFQAIATLLNLLCYDEYYENVIDACEIVTKIPVE